MRVPPSVRGTGAALAAALALLGTACRSNPCSPPSCLADAPQAQPPAAPAPRCLACEPPAAPAPVVAAAPEPPPPPIPAPAYDGGAAERIRIQEETIRRQEELARRLREELAQRDSLAATPLPSPTTLGGETAAARLADELKSQNLRAASILVEGSRVSLIVSDCFESGSDRLKPNPDVKAAITAAASAIVKNPGAKVDVVGHTDGQPLQRTLGKWGSNVELSKARARSVATALAGSGVPDERLRVDGRGEFEPLIAPEKSKSDRAKNRRVEVQISL